MLDEERRVDCELHIGAAKPVFITAIGNVVPRGEVFSLNPGEPCGGETALGGTAGLDLLGGFENFRPCLRRVGGIEAGFLEDILVVIEDRRGRIIGEGQHGAVRLGIIGDDAGQIFVLVEGITAFLQNIRHRLDGAGGTHHHTRAGVEDLNDRGRLLGAEGGNAGIQGFRIGALEDGRDLVIFLALVELFRQRIHDLVIGAGHGVPPLDFRYCICIRCDKKRKRGCRGEAVAEFFQGDSSHYENSKRYSPLIAVYPPRSGCG
ncbi:hypothetical protein D3C72_914360 [compost metagenome]